MNQDSHIILDKELRRDIDAIIQRLRDGITPVPTGVLGAQPEGRSSRERSLAVTKLQEAVMWLGMDLKSINDESGPRPADDKTERDVLHQHIASLVSDVIRRFNAGETIIGMHEADEFCERYVDTKTGNPYPNSKDPSNTVIDPTADGLKL